MDILQPLNRGLRILGFKLKRIRVRDGEVPNDVRMDLPAADFWSHNSRAHLIDAQEWVKEHTRQRADSGSVSVVFDVGGGDGTECERALGLTHTAAEHVVVDLESHPSRSNFRSSSVDITSKNLPSDFVEAADVVYSVDLLEHVLHPHIACENLAKMVRPGGVLIVSTVFSWRLHRRPGKYDDYFRFSAVALEQLCTANTPMEIICCGYDTTTRRADNRGWYPEATDVPPIDAMGGWRENWRVVFLAVAKD